MCKRNPNKGVDNFFFWKKTYKLLDVLSSHKVTLIFPKKVLLRKEI